MSSSDKPLRWVLIGDGQSPHLLKWAVALSDPEFNLELWLVSSRTVLPEWAKLISPQRQFMLNLTPRHAGGNVSVLGRLPTVARWLKGVNADWLHAHYLTSHAALAWLACKGWGLRAQILGSAWGSDILVTPQRSRLHAAWTRKILRACTLTTSDSQYMAQKMLDLGASEVMTFPFGLDSLPQRLHPKQPWLFFANRGLEPIYRPLRVVQLFEQVLRKHPQARLVIANEGSLKASLQRYCADQGLNSAVEFVGRLSAEHQAFYYSNAQWYLSQPQSDSVAVSVLEAMAHGCIVLLSDLPANRELVQHGRNGCLIGESADMCMTELEHLLQQTANVSQQNRQWVQEHGMFRPAVARMMRRVRELS
jgi:L-malate glycosyltransferase